jgi:hypothetical protein
VWGELAKHFVDPSSPANDACLTAKDAGVCGASRGYQLGGHIAAAEVFGEGVRDDSRNGVVVR